MPTPNDPAMTETLRTEVAGSVEALEAHAAAWNALAAAAPQQLPMLSHAWLAGFFEHMCPPESRWACVFAYRGTRLVAVLPIVAVVRKQFGISYTLLTTPRDDHTQIGDLLALEQDGDAAVAAVARARVEFPEASCLEINRFSAASPLLRWLQAGQIPGRHTVNLDSYGAYLPVPADYAEFRRNLSKNFRSNLNKATNKVAQLSDVRYQFDRGSQARCEDLENLMMVEASGWKGEQGSAIKASPRLVNFYSALVQRLREAGWLEWQFMHGDGAVLAGNLAIHMPQSLILWKLGYNDAYSRCSPGSILMEEVLKKASAERAPPVIDLTTDLPWYDNWGMARRPFHTVRFYFGLKGALLLGFPAAARSALKRFPPAVALKAAWDRRRKRST
jgi:CelD/BcsL family acetyltransferase involved in cellulose biosynthesis